MERNRKIDRFTYVVESFRVDRKGRVRPTTLINALFAAANRHGEARNFGSTETRGWVIARMAVHIERVPMQRERLCIETWIRNLYHGFTDRCVRVVDEEGREVASMIATLAMIDLKTRTSVDLNGDIGLRINECMLPDEELSIKRIPAINRTPVEEVSFKHTPQYSDIDINGHMNSIRYLEHILDAFPRDYIDSHNLKEVVVAYMKEGDATELLSYGIKELATDHYIAQVTKENGTVAMRCELKFA